MTGKVKKFVTGSTSLLLILLVSAKCNEEKDPEYVSMAFEIPININPESDQILLNDTLWLTGRFPDTLRESHSGKYYKLSDFNFGLNICINQLVDKNRYSSEQPGDYTMFDYVLKTGQSQQISTKCGTFEPVYIGKSYNYSIGIIPKQVGIYNIFFLPPIGVAFEVPFNLKDFINLPSGSDGRKRIPVYEPFLITINNGNTNYHLFELHCKPGIDVHAEQKGSFTFRVVE
jgi:hypothetical protein